MNAVEEDIRVVGERENMKDRVTWRRVIRYGNLYRKQLRDYK